MESQFLIILTHFVLCNQFKIIAQYEYTHLPICVRVMANARYLVHNDDDDVDVEDGDIAENRWSLSVCLSQVDFNNNTHCEPLPGVYVPHPHFKDFLITRN